MKMGGHDHEVVQEKFLLSAVVEHRVNEQTCHPFSLEERTMSPGAGGHEVDAGGEGRAIARGFGHIDLGG